MPRLPAFCGRALLELLDILRQREFAAQFYFLFGGWRLQLALFMNDIDIESLKGIAHQLRIHSIEATTAAGSGHPTSCCSAADLVAALFFGHMRYDPKNPHYYNNDRFILSKGHAAPLLYAAWAE